MFLCARHLAADIASRINAKATAVFNALSEATQIEVLDSLWLNPENAKLVTYLTSRGDKALWSKLHLLKATGIGLHDSTVSTVCKPRCPHHNFTLLAQDHVINDYYLITAFVQTV